MKGETIALFGATGHTGKEFLKLALYGDFHVQAMVRDMDAASMNLTAGSDNLVLIEGDFSNTVAIAKTVKGATYVVSMVGGSNKPKEYKKDMMLDFYKSLTKVIEDNKETNSVKIVLYQAGAFSPLPDQPLPVVASFFKKVVGEWINGSGPKDADNTAVIQHIYDNRATLPFQTIVSRPGALHDKPSKEVLKADYFSSTNFAITFHDLAVWSLAAIQDEAIYGKFPFVVPVDKDHMEAYQPSIDKVVDPVAKPINKGVEKMKPGITEPLDRAIDPIRQATDNAIAAVQGATKPLTDKMDKILS